MKNKAFQQLSEIEKREKFRRTLQKKTSNNLLPSELDFIVGNIPVWRQYAIKIYRDPNSFFAASSPVDGICTRTILDLQDINCAAAFTSWARDIPHSIRVLHIYIPAARKKERKNRNEQKRMAMPRLV